VKKEKAGYYEKKLAEYEKELEGLKQYKRQLEEKDQEIAKILISPFALHELLKGQEYENRKLLKEERKEE